ncbi:hypothetical protein FOMPIDRAFT_1021253, partial [Fomitopsis schrenkii]
MKISESIDADSFPEAWSTFARKATVERRAFELLASTYVAFVWGCLQTLASNTVSKYLGLACSIAAIVAVVYMEVCRASVPRYSEPWKGLVWTRTFGHSSLRSSWKYPPKLLAIPAVWVAWATTTLIAFIVVEAWVGLDNNVSSEISSARALKAVLSVLITVQVAVAIAQAAYVIPAFGEWCGPGREVDYCNVEMASES